MPDTPRDRPPDPPSETRPDRPGAAGPSDSNTVRSDLADPSRPGGQYGVRQPIEPDPQATPDAIPDGDPALARLVTQTLRGDGRLEGQHLSVNCAGGVVSLEGRVALEFQRTLAVALVQSVPGVLTVENRLEVGEIAQPMSPGVQSPGDETVPGHPGPDDTLTGPARR